MLDKFLNYPNKSMLDYDLRFLYGLRKRIPLEGNGPRKMIMENGKLYIPTYFADILNIVDAQTCEIATVNLNPDREESAENKGERTSTMHPIVFKIGKAATDAIPETPVPTV